MDIKYIHGSTVLAGYFFSACAVLFVFIGGNEMYEMVKIPLASTMKTMNRRGQVVFLIGLCVFFGRFDREFLHLDFVWCAH
jgi:hypothetical protein